MSKKRILYIHHGKGLGGAPLSLLYLIEGLDKTKYEPIVLFLHHSDAFDLYKSKGIHVEGPVNLYDFSHTKIYWYRWYHIHLFLRALSHTIKTSFFAADHWLDKIKPDIIHLNTSSLGVWAKVAHKKNIPVVCHVREPLAAGYFGLRKSIVKNLVEKHSTVILPICKNDAKPWKGLEKVSVVYNAVDKDKFNKDLEKQEFLLENNFDKHVPKILFLGGLSEEKGTLVAFEVFKKLLNLIPNAQLLVAGYFDLSLKNRLNLKRYFPSQTYKMKVGRVLKGIKNNVLFLGPIKNVEQFMAISDVIVFPATVGHFARPVIEAGFMGKPVIASDLPPLDELVLEGETGFLIDTKKHELWIRRLHALLTNKVLNKKMGQSAFEHCLKNFNLNDQILKIEGVYKEI